LNLAGSYLYDLKSENGSLKETGFPIKKESKAVSVRTESGTVCIDLYHVTYYFDVDGNHLLISQLAGKNRSIKISSDFQYIFIYFYIMFLIALTIIIIGVFLYINLRWKKKEKAIPTSEIGNEPATVASDCCGAHEVCEFDEADFNEEIIMYFEDEELDVLRNVRENDLTADQIDHLREVLYTLKPHEISKWMTSLGRRHIHLPAILKQEAVQLASEN